MTTLEIILIAYIVLSNILMVLFMHTRREKSGLLMIYAIIGLPLTSIILSIKELIEDRKENRK